jgi:hypothetical protein
MKVLHVSHHQGCRDDLDYVAARLGVTLDHYEYRGGYNISAARAHAVWQTERERFLAYDVIITSDTAPLSRIFLQSGWPKGLVIWVCNRFDYCDEATNDCGFPDADYYALFRSAIGRPRTVVASYTAFEHHYARHRGVAMGALTVRPVGARLPRAFSPLVPPDVDRAATCFVPTYHNDVATALAGRLQASGAAVYSGRYGGPWDLRGFRAVVHVPYAWSNFALFENMQSGLPYLVPSRQFLASELAELPGFFWSPPFQPERLELSEWYAPDHAGIFVYFDSWEHLGALVRTSLAERRASIAAFCRAHTENTLEQWRDILERVG